MAVLVVPLDATMMVSHSVTRVFDSRETGSENLLVDEKCVVFSIWFSRGTPKLPDA